VDGVRQNLASTLAALGVTLAVVLGTAPTAAQEAKAQTVTVVGVQGAWQADYHGAPFTYAGTVCSVAQDWWTDFCAQHAGPLGTTITIDETNPYRAYLVAHEGFHALMGRSGPPDDPDREREAHAAGCRARYIPDFCDHPQ